MDKVSHVFRLGDYDNIGKCEAAHEIGLSRVYSDRLLNSDSHLACYIDQILE